MNRAWSLGFISISLLASSMAFGIVIFEVDMSGQSVNSANTFAPTNVASNVSVSNLTKSSDFVVGDTETLTAIYGLNNWTSGSSLAPNARYSTITATPDPGFQITFDGGIGTTVHEYQVAREFSNGFQNFEIRGSTSGDFSNPANYRVMTSGTSANWFSNRASGSTSQSVFSDLTATNANPLEVRVYLFNDSGGGGYAGVGSFGRNLTIGGSVSAIPEPSTYPLILGALALGGCLLLRKNMQGKP